MVEAVWRVVDPMLKVDDFLGRHSSIRPDAVWRRGERGLGRRLHEDSGFNLLLAETEEKQVGRAARSRLERHVEALTELRSMKIASLVDFAVMLGPEDLLSETVVLAPDDLVWLGTHGVAVALSAYAASEDEEPS